MSGTGLKQRLAAILAADVAGYSRLKGVSILRNPEDRRHYMLFLRIAAGLEDPSAAEALR